MLIDWGNTNLKYHRLDALAEVVSGAQIGDAEIEYSPERLVTHSAEAGVSEVLVASVRSDEDNQKLLQTFSKRGITPFFAKTPRSFDDIQCGYDEPSSLGIDRWLTIIAACQVEQTIGIIDIGSAITLDIVRSNVHLGGHILPGERLLKNSLLNTANVHVQHGSEKMSQGFQLGHSTLECVDAGIEQMISGYLVNSINQAEQNYSVKSWFLTGGGGEYWSNWLIAYYGRESKFQFEHQPNLVFQGLAQVFMRKSIK